MKYQRGIAIPWAMIALLVALVSSMALVAYFKSRMDTERVGRIASETAHDIFVKQTRHANESYEAAYALATKRTTKVNNKWGERHAKQIANNKLLWDNNEWLRDQNRHVVITGQTPPIPRESINVNCGNSGSQFADAFGRQHDSVYSGIRRLDKEVRENLARFRERISTGIAQPRDECVIRTINIKGWAEERSLIDAN